METVNERLFLLLNAPHDPFPATLMFAHFLAEDVVLLVAALMVALWVRGRRETWVALISIGCGLLVSAGISTAIEMGWQHPRPFMVGLGHTLLVHAPETSFPSDHATFMWTVALCLMLVPPLRRLGWGLFVLGVGVAWARIYLGVHFPLDMPGSLAVAVLATLVVASARNWIAGKLTPALVGIYERMVLGLRLPARVFPVGRQR